MLMRTCVSQPGCYYIRNSVRSIRWAPVSLRDLAGLPRILPLRLPPTDHSGSMDGVVRTFLTSAHLIYYLKHAHVVLFNFILFYHLLWHNGGIHLLFVDVFTELFCVRLIIFIAHRPKRLACFARCCSKVRHAGTGTIFCLLPSPYISNVLLIVGNWPKVS